MWKSVIVAKYGEWAVGNGRLDVEGQFWGVSGWWRAICRLDNGLNWFSQLAVKKLGNGNTTRFWKDVWIEGQSLQSKFPRLYGISVQQEALVCDVGRWENGVWLWGWLWRRNLFVWEENLMQQLLDLLSQVTVSEANDRWVWSLAIQDGFSVKSLYVFLERTLLNHDLRSPMELFAFKHIWKSGVPSKVSAMAWQLLLDRVPTRDNLHQRGVVGADGISCPLCAAAAETPRHLFLHCHFAAGVWFKIIKWLGVFTVLPPNVLTSYVMFVGFGSNKKRRKGHSIVWLAFIWAMWKCRNDRIFKNKVAVEEDVVDYIQRLSWQWYLHYVAKSACRLYEWVWNPGECMLR
jgi:hypothetical protein